MDIPKGSELDLQEAVARAGPVAVGVDAKHYEFRFYDHGVFDYSKCSSTKLSHAMLVVGYGTADASDGYGVGEGRDYWIVKNRYVPIGWLKGYRMILFNIVEWLFHLIIC